MSRPIIASMHVGELWRLILVILKVGFDLENWPVDADFLWYNLKREVGEGPMKLARRQVQNSVKLK